jgi:hypothetical protein
VTNEARKRSTIEPGKRTQSVKQRSRLGFLIEIEIKGDRAGHDPKTDLILTAAVLRGATHNSGDGRQRNDDRRPERAIDF